MLRKINTIHIQKFCKRFITKTSLLLFFFIIFHERIIISKETNPEDIIQLPVGNLALPSPQQPGTLFGFGQNIVNQYNLQSFIFIDSLIGHHQNFTEVIFPFILYGIRDDFSILFGLPIATHFKIRHCSSSGPQDFVIQAEYAPYISQTTTSINIISLVASLYCPTGSFHKVPPTGFGSTSFFLGFTASHLSTQWYCYTSAGAFLTTKHKCIKLGNQFLYQAGFGKNIAYSSNRWLLTWMIEFFGTYVQKNKINRINDANSGSNVIFLGPSLWFSTQRFIAQAGIAPVISQHFFGKQLKDSVLIAFSFGWRFH